MWVCATLSHGRPAALAWVLLAALLLPVWLSAVGFPTAPPFPNVALPSLLWHLVYGVVLGAVFASVRDL